MKKCLFNMFSPFRNYTESFMQGVEFIKKHQQEFCKENNIDYLSKDNFLNECTIKLRAASTPFGLAYNEKIAISDYMRCKYALHLLSEYDIVIYTDIDVLFLKEFRLPEIDSSIPIYIAKEITVENHFDEIPIIKETNSVTNTLMIFTQQSKKILETILAKMVQLSKSDKKLYYGSYCTVIKEGLEKTKTGMIYGLCYLYEASSISAHHLEVFLLSHNEWWKKNYQTPVGFLNISFSSNYYRLGNLLHTISSIDIYKNSPYSIDESKNLSKDLIEKEDETIAIIKICSSYANGIADDKIKKYKKKIKKIIILTSLGILLFNTILILLVYFFSTK